MLTGLNLDHFAIELDVKAVLGFLLVLAATPLQALPASESIVRANDNVAVYVYEYAPSGTSKKSFPILMFHMAGGDARGELDQIATKLAGQGRRIFTADLRSGGNRFRREYPGVAVLEYTNKTALAFPAEQAMCSAYIDTEAALDHVWKVTGQKAILTGSSYSAALAVQLAARRPDAVAAVVAFSPASGAPLAGCEPEPWLSALRVPAWAVRPKGEAELDWVAEQRQIWGRFAIPTSVYELDAHGTSILDSQRAKGDSAPVWHDFEQFLDTVGRDEAIEVISGDWSLKGDLRHGLGEGPRPTALLLNKAAGDRKAYERLAGELARQGITSLRLDLRGHGESTTRGKFDPQKTGMKLIDEAWKDVISALNFMNSRQDIDKDKIAIIGASYSAEAMAGAARNSGRYVKAYIGLSPGSFSEESARAIDVSGAKWLFIRSLNERFAAPAIERARALSKKLEVIVVEGESHATDILASSPATSARISEWLKDALR